MKTFLWVVFIAAVAHAEPTEYGKLNAKAVQLFTEHKYDEAVAAGEEALKIAEQTLAPDDKDLLIVLENLASIYASAKKADQAKATYERILAFKEKDAATTPASKASTLLSLGDLELEQKDWAAAEGYFKRCLDIREKSLGADHNDTVNAVNRL